jgi:branched-chain amino acid transport system permease protein
MGSIIGATLMVVVLEVLREFKAAQEIIFGAVLIAFVIFQPHGVVALFKKLPGWEEPLNSAGAVGRGRDYAEVLDRPTPELAADERP